MIESQSAWPSTFVSEGPATRRDAASRLTFVNHHDCKEKAENAKEGAVDVVLDTDADLL